METLKKALHDELLGILDFLASIVSFVATLILPFGLAVAIMSIVL